MTRRQLAVALAAVFVAPRLKLIETGAERLRVFGASLEPLGAALNGEAGRVDFTWSGVAQDPEFR